MVSKARHRPRLLLVSKATTLSVLAELHCSLFPAAWYNVGTKPMIIGRNKPMRKKLFCTFLVLVLCTLLLPAAGLAAKNPFGFLSRGTFIFREIFTERTHIKAIFQRVYVDICSEITRIKSRVSALKSEGVGVIYLLPSKSVTNVHRCILGNKKSPLG